ncbi:MAG TPA: pseudaminic acid biosynthesis-associated methylase [Terriglobales bacterium]|nr:pseudaminic acid biosynthesis-associated methylase [Terriglobales bacterium]
MPNALQTPQVSQWAGQFGLEYTERNNFTPEQVDELWARNYGQSRTELNRVFFSVVPAEARILEVGCNIGNQLRLLQRLGYQNLYGIDVQERALEVAKSRAQNINFLRASAFALPFQDGYFDLVYTSGVLIHISPQDLPIALGEIYRCSRRFILGSEYYAAQATEVDYRGHSALLWKMDYAREYLGRFPDLQLLMEQRLPYVNSENVDSMFLLEKK